MKVQIQSVAKSCDQKIRSIQEFKEAEFIFPRVRLRQEIRILWRQFAKTAMEHQSLNLIIMVISLINKAIAFQTICKQKSKP